MSDDRDDWKSAICAWVCAKPGVRSFGLSQTDGRNGCTGHGAKLFENGKVVTESLARTSTARAVFGALDLYRDDARRKAGNA